MDGDAPDSPRWWRRLAPQEADGFRYLKVDGSPLRSEAALARIRSLAIPPAWTDVHISPHPERKLQAWGRDAAGRKQYIYHPAYVRRRKDRKWRRVLRYARALPHLRKVTNRHLQREVLDREKVLATVVRLMSRAYFRVGSERYAVRNRTFGICTLRKEHLEIRGHDLVFTYEGKRRRDQRRVVADTPLVEILHDLLALEGDRLFRYRDGAGETRNVTARAVNRYLRDAMGARYTSKDLRTFGGTVRAATILADLGPPDDEREARRNCALCCRLVASELGNTPAICRDAYIHPAVLREYLDAGRTIDPLMGRSPRAVAAETPVDYYPEEVGLMRFLKRYG
ncbi:MAG: DNA topoisomerase IB [Gemmatimonadota bacterium]